MVSLKLPATVDMRLSPAKDKTSNDIAVLGGLALIIVIGDFYQFPLVVERLLWNHLVIGKEIYGKSI